MWTRQTDHGHAKPYLQNTNTGTREWHHVQICVHWTFSRASLAPSTFEFPSTMTGSARKEPRLYSVAQALATSRFQTCVSKMLARPESNKVYRASPSISPCGLCVRNWRQVCSPRLLLLHSSDRTPGFTELMWFLCAWMFSQRIGCHILTSSNVTGWRGVWKKCRKMTVRQKDRQNKEQQKAKE